MRPGLLRFTFLTLALTLVVGSSAFATHLRAGEITVRRDACNSLKFWITVTVFTNTINTNVLFGGEDDILDFGDGSDPDGDGTPGILVPETQNTLRPDLGNGIATAFFTIAHIYPAYSTYLISYSEPNRNEGVVNMDGSVNTRFYIETEISVDPFLGCNPNTPSLAVPPIDRGCTRVAWFHNPGAFDLDGDSLSFQLVIPNKARENTVANYREPNHTDFYTNFQRGNEAGTGPPVFKIDPVTGTLTWDAPGSAGEYNIAFEILEWRKVAGEWIRMGFVRRDMQIIIEECDNKRPDLILPEDVCIEAGTTLDATIFGTDPDFNKVKIEAFSEIFGLAATQFPATYTPNTNPPTWQSTTTPAELHFQWKTDCSHVKEQPYIVVFKITDDGKPNLVTFKTWLIRVVGPDPEWVNATVDLSDRSADLVWDEYFCSNATSMQVWRRVDSLAFEPDSCQTGMPENLGYTLIDEVALIDGSGNPVTTYTDTNNGSGLAPGAVYCYRLVAIFPAPRGGESYVSKEVCIPAILADAPVITHVTVDKTGKTDGQITVRWVEPFEADPAQYPPPYSYEVYRAEGFSGDINLTKVAGNDPLQTFATDQNLNTEDKVYNYRIYARDANGNPLDSSAIASSVRLEAQSRVNRIELIWNAVVPWSNQSEGLKHKIYRRDDNPQRPTLPSQLTFLTEVDVLRAGFKFMDGENDDLEPAKEYCYVVETFGTYGNEDPLIKDREPFQNFSQIVCAQPGDEEPPCQPAPPLAHEPVDCETYISQKLTCSNNLLISNTLKWNRPSDEECGTDIAYYHIYVAPSSDGDFVALQDQNQQNIQVKDTFYIHQNLPSFAGCYKISAVDRSGNESDLSEAICFDNCPYYELPNVFSPNNDGCNDVFSAYSDRDFVGEDESTVTCLTSDISKAKCARFVRKVSFKVFNRWGKEVYSYVSGGERTIFIDWNGRAEDGSELATGIYYYVADVSFESANPAKRNQTIKGWVHLIR